MHKQAQNSTHEQRYRLAEHYLVPLSDYSLYSLEVEIPISQTGVLEAIKEALSGELYIVNMCSPRSSAFVFFRQPLQHEIRVSNPSHAVQPVVMRVRRRPEHGHRHQ